MKNNPSIDAARKTDRFRQFHDVLFERYRIRLSGPGHLLDRMKGLWKYFAQGFQDSETARKHIHRGALHRAVPRCRRRLFGQAAWNGCREARHPRGLL